MTPWKPVEVAERHQVLDLLRGIALFGVLLVNLLYFFRLHLFTHILNFHSHPGALNHAIDLFVAEFVEFKAFDAFAMTFGIGLAIQADRSAARGISTGLFLARRCLVLLAIGTVHMVLVSNVDILMMYGLCGLMAIPLLRLPPMGLAAAGLAAIYLPSIPGGWLQIPASVTTPESVERATHIYATGGFVTITAFRWHETQHWILPLLAGVAQQAFGLMLIGAAVWRSGLVVNPARHRRQLWTFSLVAGTIGFVNSTGPVLSRIGLQTIQVPVLGILGTDVPIALAYIAALLAWPRTGNPSTFATALAAAGRMALTNYLTQSLVFGVLFNGYGFGLFGKLDQQTATALGIAVYCIQLWFSAWWLNRYRFGPCEWAWRSATYGRPQPMRLAG